MNGCNRCNPHVSVSAFARPLGAWLQRPAGRCFRRAGGVGGGKGGGGGSNCQKRLGEDSRSPENPNAWPILIAALLAGGSSAAAWASPQDDPSKNNSEAVSIIIPALNEEKCIAEAVSYLKALSPAPLEIILVDGGSSDRTVRLARKAGARIVKGTRGRAVQMNLGAKAAKGSLLCFVHADSTPPPALVRVIQDTLQEEGVVLGGFRTIIEDAGRELRFMTAHQFLKTFYLPLVARPLAFFRGGRCLFGDQTLFCRSKDFRRVGGFREDLPIMEDVDLCIRLHEAGPASAAAMPASAVSAAAGRESASHGHGGRHLGKPGRKWGRVKMVMWPPARTSGRRLAAWGNLKATTIHFRLGLGWYMGATPKELKDMYDRLYTDNYR